MNERTLELAKQAGITFEPMSIDGVVYEYDYVRLNDNIGDDEAGCIKKFAELLVKKFDDILVLEYLDCVGNKDRQASERVQRLREKVKTYFGVEE